jgi:hypothetical protein
VDQDPSNSYYKIRNNTAKNFITKSGKFRNEHHQIQINTFITLLKQMKHMLERIRRLVNPTETLYESPYLTVTEEDDEYVFTPERPRDHTEIIVGSNRYQLESKTLNFSKQLIHKNNAAVYRNQTKFTLGETLSQSTINVYLNETQIQNLTELTLNRQNALTTNSEFEYTVSKLDDLWCITLSNLLENIPYRLELLLDGGMPDIKVQDINGSNGTNIDVSRMEERFVTCSVPSHMNGDFLVNKSATPFNELNGNTQPLTEFTASSMYLYEDEDIQESIQKWNNSEIQVVARPNNYTNFSKIQELTEQTTLFKFNESEFNELATVTITYPEHIDANPWISHKETEYDAEHYPEYVKQYNRDDNTYTFEQSVYPSEEIVIFHGDMLWFEDNTTRTSIESGETKTFEPELTQKKIRFTLENDTEQSVLFNLNDETIHIKPDNQDAIETSITDENPISVTTTNGKKLVSKTLNRREILENKNTTVSQIS